MTYIPMFLHIIIEGGPSFSIPASPLFGADKLAKLIGDGTVIDEAFIERVKAEFYPDGNTSSSELLRFFEKHKGSRIRYVLSLSVSLPFPENPPNQSPN